MTTRWTYLIISVPDMSDMRKHTPQFFQRHIRKQFNQPPGNNYTLYTQDSSSHDNDSGNVKHFKIETLFADVAVYINKSGRTP